MYHTAGAILAGGWLEDFAHKIRYMASRNEYSKKRLGEISTAAYNTSLENAKYRNRYCDYFIDFKTNSPHSNVF